MHHFVWKKKEKIYSVKKKDRRYKKEKKKDKKRKKQKYIHMTREPMAVLFSCSQYRVIQKCSTPEWQEKINSKWAVLFSLFLYVFVSIYEIRIT